MPGIELPGGGDVDRGRTASIIVLTQVAFAFMIVMARFYARIMIKGLGKDDWAMLVTLCLFISYGALMTYEWKLGGFRHLYYLLPAQVMQVAKMNYIIQVNIVFAFITGKAAVGFLVLRIMSGDSTAWRRWLVYGAMGLTALINSLDCIFTYVQCSPPRALWDPSIAHTCWDPNVQSRFAMFTAAENCLADIVLALVPASVIMNLNMEMKKRINLTILLGLGLIAAICCIVKTTFLGSLNAHSDLTWKTYDLLVWSGSELFVIIVCGSIPPLKPYWDRWVSGKTPTAYGSGHGNCHNSQLSSFRARRKNRMSYMKHSSGDTGSSSDHVYPQNIHGDKYIQRTTDIEIHSVRVPSGDSMASIC
ncbi:hypothetical protein SBOR_1481 [Sclerotinia borealis F-4128]|uniref:Rhodopsin domain-containing protein n=1 Tax=Sclerotinia borealis (strain F-4128) TaxID=1432307 RepID=W9CMR9_SCLBF|nr:hypothetical protein SBOR_1481 [Sclerotinia borealis F-4128]